jgi:hypothetical protein
MPFIVMVYATTPDQARGIRDYYEHNANGRVVGIYPMAKARTTPTCTGFCGAGSAWTRHRHNGFLVHACGKRHRDWRRRIGRVLFDTFGINLMHRKSTPAMFQNPEGWGS